MSFYQFFEREDLQTAIHQYPSHEYLTLLSENLSEKSTFPFHFDNVVSMIGRLTLAEDRASIQNDFSLQKFIQELRDQMEKEYDEIQREKEENASDRQRVREQCQRLIQRYILKLSVVFLSRNKYRRRFTRYARKYGFQEQQLHEFESHCIYNKKASILSDLLEGVYHENNVMFKAYCLMIVKYLRRDFMRELLSSKSLQNLKGIIILVKNRLIQKLSVLWSQQIKQQ